MKNILITSTLCLTLVACAGKESEKIAAMQKKDKNLTCREVMLEQNEAEFYKATAEKNKNPNVKTLLMPLGYVSTYMSAEEAVSAANARVDYLARVYEIMDCDNKLQMATRKNKIVNRQMSETIDNSEDGTPMPAPVLQPAMQPMPQGYVVPQPMMMVPQRMSYQPQGPMPMYQPMGYYPQQAINPLDVREPSSGF